MKKLLAACILLTVSFALKAQSFTVTTAFQSFSGAATSNDIPSPAWSPTINNVSGDTITLRWVRVEENIPGWWRSSVCTELYCYSIPDDSATWNLLPGDADMLYVHIYPYGYSDTGNVVIKLFDVNNPADSVRVTFHCDVTTGIEEHSSFAFLGADPLTHTVKFSPAESGSWSLMDISGRIISSAEAKPGETYAAEVQNSGVYFFSFVNEAGFVETRKLIL